MFTQVCIKETGGWPAPSGVGVSGNLEVVSVEEPHSSQNRA